MPPSPWCLVNLREASLHPPALDDDNAQGEGQIPWVLLEERAYVADRRNSTTASTDSKFGAQIQVTFCFARPPRVSYLCVFCSRRPADAKEAEVIALEPLILSTDANVVLLSIALSPDKALFFEPDLYIYRPAGAGGPSLTLLERPPGDRIFRTSEVGVLSFHTNRPDESSGLRPHGAPQDKPYMVAALCFDWWRLERDQFILYLYDSKPGSWTTYTVSIEEQHFQKHQEGGYFMHSSSKVIAIGGKDGTVGFVDLWRGILLCDLLLVKDNPRLRYITIPPPLWPDAPIHGDGRLSRDIAVVDDSIRFVEQQTFWKPCPFYRDQYVEDGWMAAIWSRLITSPVEDAWERKHTIKSPEMDISNPQFELLPKMHDNAGRPLPPFEMLSIYQPTLSLLAGDATVCFMVKIDMGDDKAWTIVVDMSNNKLQGVVKFDATRSACVDLAYVHSGISKYLKVASGTEGNLKRPGLLLLGPSSKKQPWWGGGEKQQDAKMEVLTEDGGDNMVLDLGPSE